eukprot:445992_1
MATLSQTIGPLFRQVLNEQSHLATEPVPSQSQFQPTFTNQTQPQHVSYNPTFTHPTLQQQSQLNSQYIYQPKKAGIVNGIINSINEQHQKLLEGITISEENMSNFNFQYRQLFRKYDMMNALEQRLKKNYCHLEKKFNEKISLISDLKGQVNNIKIYQNIIQEQQYKIHDLVRFIYKYLDGKNKNLKDTMLKIIGNNYIDLRKYKLKEPTQLKDLYISSKDINITSFASSDIADQIDHIKTPEAGDNRITNESKEKELLTKEKFEKKKNEANKKKSKQLLEII